MFLYLQLSMFHMERHSRNTIITVINNMIIRKRDIFLK